MYLSAHDEGEGLAAWYVAALSGTEWDRHLDDVAKVAAWRRPPDQRAAVVLIAPASFTRPDAVIRKRLARITEAATYNPHLSCVTSNEGMHGLLTSLSWMHAQSHYELQFHTTIEASLAWLELRRGRRLPMLSSMVAQIQSRSVAGASESSGSAARGRSRTP